MKTLFHLLFISLGLIGSCYNAVETGEAKNSTTVPSSSFPPVTSTSAPPTPGPINPKPELLLFNLTDSNNHTCARFSFMATVEIRNVNDTKQEVKSIPLTNLTILDNNSLCSENLTTLVLIVNNKTETTLKLLWNRTDSGYILDDIEFANSANGHIFRSNETQITINSGKSYLCKSQQEIQLSSVNDKIGYLILKDLHVDVFKSNDNNEWRTAQECAADYPSNDVVPLVVGCALITLVFIVLIAYIVGRKRSRRLTYQSV